MRFMILAVSLTLLNLGAAWAGELWPTDVPGPTMRSLQDIYDEVAQLNAAVGGGDKLLFFSHIVDSPGTISSSPYSFDTMIVLVATGPYVGTGLKSGAPSEADKAAGDVEVRLYLYDNLGQPALSSTATPVAFPAVFTVGPITPRVSVNITTLFQNAGGFVGSSDFQGFAFLSISSGNWNDVAVQAFLVNSHANAFDLVLTPLEPEPIPDPPVKSSEAADPAREEQK